MSRGRKTLRDPLPLRITLVKGLSLELNPLKGIIEFLYLTFPIDISLKLYTQDVKINFFEKPKSCWWGSGVIFVVVSMLTTARLE